jgi:CheY-like chemotaxis protein
MLPLTARTGPQGPESEGVLDTSSQIEALEERPAYVVVCNSCRASFDAAAAAWCSCLVTERTLVCPSCERCFCNAAASYKNRFWSVAPKALWDAKWSEHRQAVGPWAVALGSAPAQGPLVLVVDDEEDIRRVAAVVLSGLGCRVVFARDGADGLKMAHDLQPDLVLTDALMPRLDGRDLCRQLKDDPETAGVPVVVMTSLYTSVRHRMAGFKHYGADEYLAKPVDPTELRSVVQRLARRPPPATASESVPAGSPEHESVGSLACS